MGIKGDAEKRMVALVMFLLLLPFASADYIIGGSHVDDDSDGMVDIINPGEDSADITFTIYTVKDDPVEVRKVVGGSSKALFDLSKITDASFFGIAVASDQEVAVSHFQYDGTHSGGFGGPAASDASKTWYFAEGYTSGMAKTFLFLLNTNARSADVNVALYYEGGERKTFTVDVPARRLVVLDMKERTLPEKRFGMYVSSTLPIVAETANYNRRLSAGSGGLGATSLARKIYFPAGSSGTDESDFINILNPSSKDAVVTLRIFYDDGKAASTEVDVPARSKIMVLVNNFVEVGRDYAFVVESDVPVAAEQTHYDASVSAGYGGMGITQPSQVVFFPAGISEDKVSNTLAVFNHESRDAALTLEVYYADSTVRSSEASAPAGRRTTIDLDSLAQHGKLYGVKVTSDVPLYMQQVFYEGKYSAGFGGKGVELEIEEAPEEKAALPQVTGAAVDVPEDTFMLAEQEDVSPSRFRESISEGLDAVVKYRYERDDQVFTVWEFTYADSQGAQRGLEGALDNGLFIILERSPADVSGLPAQRFVAENTEGLVMQEGDRMLAFVGPKGSTEVPDLADMFLANSRMDGEAQGLGLSKILLIIVLLVLLVVILRWLFRRSAADETELDDEYVWKDEIPSAVPANEVKRRETEKGHKKAGADKKKAPSKMFGKGHKKDDPKKEALKKEEHKKERKVGRPRGTVKKKDAETPKRPVGRPRKPVPESRRIELKEKPDRDKTAQDFLDELEDIPDYEDVFRHVNREHEEIKPK